MLINRKRTLIVRKPSLQSQLLMMWLFELVAMTIARFILTRLGIMESIARTVVLWGIASIPLIYFFSSSKNLKSYLYIPALFLYMLIGFGMLLSVLLNPELAQFYIRSDYGLERIIRPDQALYAFLFFSLFENPRELENNITQFAFVDFFYLIVLSLIPALLRGYWIDIGPSGKELHFSYSLSFGYAMTFPTIVFWWKTLKERKILYAFFSLVGSWSILTQGNRGALLVLLIYAGLMVISGIVDGKTTSKKVFKILLLLSAMLVIAILGDILLDLGLRILSNSGIDSRNVEMILHGKIASDNGRERIWRTVLNAIKTGGIFGYGILGDRPFVSPIHYAGYSHNIIFELLCSLGIIGAFIVIYIIVDAIRMIFFCKDTEWREIYIIFFSVSCQLILSMSFWYVWEFWAAAAIAYRYRKTTKKRAFQYKPLTACRHTYYS